jgi:hypothetical protein
LIAENRREKPKSIFTTIELNITRKSKRADSIEDTHNFFISNKAEEQKKIISL